MECKSRLKIIDGYICRDLNGMLWFYSMLPIKGENEWYPNSSDNFYFILEDSPLFKHVKWKDEKPLSSKIELNYLFSLKF